MVVTVLKMCHMSAPHFFEIFIFFFRIFHATCHFNIVPRVKSLSESQFDPYICYFDYILVHLF